LGEPIGRFALMKSTSPKVLTDYSRSLSLFFTMFAWTTCLADLNTWFKDSADNLSSLAFGNACSRLTSNNRFLMSLTLGNGME